MLERIFEPENVNAALKHLAGKHDAFSLGGILQGARDEIFKK